MSSMRARTTIPFYVRRTSILTYRAACVWSQAVKARLDIILFFWFHSVSCTCDPCVLAEWVSERESILQMSDIRKTHDRTPRCVRTIDSVITRIYSIYMVLPTVFWSSIASTSLRVAYTRFFLQLNILVYFIQPIAALFSRLRKPNPNVFCFAVDCVMVTNRYSFSIEFFDECSLKLFHQSSRKMAPPNERRAIINVFSNHSHNVGRSVIRKHWRRFGCGEKTRTISLNKLLDFNCHNQCTVWHDKNSQIVRRSYTIAMQKSNVTVKCVRREEDSTDRHETYIESHSCVRSHLLPSRWRFSLSFCSVDSTNSSLYRQPSILGTKKIRKKKKMKQKN